MMRIEIATALLAAQVGKEGLPHSTYNQLQQTLEQTLVIADMLLNADEAMEVPEPIADPIVFQMLKGKRKAKRA